LSGGLIRLPPTNASEALTQGGVRLTVARRGNIISMKTGYGFWGTVKDGKREIPKK